jgi:hypothetical protein
MTRRRVVVTGLGLISPVGNTVQDGWANLVVGRTGIGAITRFDAASFACRFAGLCSRDLSDGPDVRPPEFCVDGNVRPERQGSDRRRLGKGVSEAFRRTRNNVVSIGGLNGTSFRVRFEGHVKLEASPRVFREAV